VRVRERDGEKEREREGGRREGEGRVKGGREGEWREKGLGPYSMSFVIHRMTILCHLSLPFDVIWRGNLAILYRYPSPNAIEWPRKSTKNDIE